MAVVVPYRFRVLQGAPNTGGAERKSSSSEIARILLAANAIASHGKDVESRRLGKSNI